MLKELGRIRRLVFLLSILGMIMVSNADTGSIADALTMLCALFYQILPVGVLLVITLAGVIFAIGQTMGAETRARANVWATNLMIGGLIAGAVTILAPAVISYLIPDANLSTTCSSSNGGTGGNNGGSGGGPNGGNGP